MIIYHRLFIILIISFLPLATSRCVQAGEDLPSIKYQKATLDNGLRIIMVEHHELPVVAIELLVKAGSANDPQERPGLANLTAQLLREGTRSKSSLEISEEIDFIGATLDVDCDYDSTSIGSTALVRHFRTMLDMLSEVARYPSFKPQEIEFQRDKAVTSIQRERDNKRNIADRHFGEMLYGTHPYNHPPVGTTEGLKAVTGEEITRFHKRYYQPGNSILTVVGDIDPAGTLTAIEETFGDWEDAGKVEEATPPPIPGITGHRIRMVDKPDLTQTEIRIGHLGIRRADPDYFPLLLLNSILGRGPTSRLYTQIRAERGLSYGVSSRFDARMLQGPFYIRTYSKNETALEAMWLVLDELRKLKSGGVTAEELDAAKSYYIGHFPLGLETPTQIASKIIDQEFYGLPENYLEEYLDNVSAVSRQDVNRAARRFLDPDNLIIVLVSRAEDTLKDALTLGKVELKGL
ncbi:MAG: insulinase family protein [Candidatus Brocadiales bacterium]|nr:insulinase family protein [Candidatus Bathyanammoxibius amoris]